MRKILAATIVIAAFTAACREHRRPVAPAPEGFDSTARNLSAKMHPVVYRYSVVAGGVESREDVEDAMKRDPVVARHYADINVAVLEAVKLKDATAAYVSFRKDGQVYWTSRKVYLPKGDRVLSDGPNCVRARCGNRISWDPRGPVLPKESEEPTSSQLNTPEVRGQSMDDLFAAFQPLQPNWVTPNSFPVMAATPAPSPAPGAAMPALSGGGGGGAGGSGFSPAGPYLGATPTTPVSSTPSNPLSPVTPISPPATAVPTIVASLTALVPPLTVTIGGGTPVPILPGGTVITTPVSPTVPVTPTPPPFSVTPGTPGVTVTPPDVTPPQGPTPPTPDDPVKPPPPPPDIVPPAVPEPSSMVLFGLGISMLVAIRSRRGSSQ